MCVTETSYQLSALPTACLGATCPELPSRHEIRTRDRNLWETRK